MDSKRWLQLKGWGGERRGRGNSFTQTRPPSLFVCSEGVEKVGLGGKERGGGEAEKGGGNQQQLFLQHKNETSYSFAFGLHFFPSTL